MRGFSILMFIFGLCILLTGFYMFKGHKLNALAWRAPYKGVDKNGWKNIGKWTMIVSAIPFILVLIGLIFEI